MRLFSNIKVILLCAFVLSSSLYAQNLSKKDLLEFYPYNIGNSWSYLWVYHNIELDYYEAGRDKIVISKDTVVNNVKYWLIKYDNHGYEYYTKYLERIDSTTGNVFRIGNLSSGEIDCIDNVYARVGDTISISNNRNLLYCNKIIVKSIRDTVINNYRMTIREVEGIPYSRKLIFARKIGLLGSGKNYWIDSAKVNGMTFSHITDILENDIPSTFDLSQNYPNPFNPSTTIRYQIPVVDALSAAEVHVSLKVCDVLGREIATLVDEYKQPGNYEVKFDVSHSERSRGIPSGIYFYRMQTGNPSSGSGQGYSETKKMVLMK